jgi:hypothetical protein
MYYDWPKIVQEKSIKELYNIVTGQTILPYEAINAAKKEIEKRGFNIDNSDQIKKNIELESLIDERNSTIWNRIFNPPSKVWLRQFYFSIFFTIITALNLIFDFLKIDEVDSWFYFLFCLFFVAFNFYGYKNRKKRDKFIRDRISELKEEL